MAKLTAKARKALPKSTFALPNTQGYPLNNPSHDRAAISGASRAFNAGNISSSTKAMIQAKARKKLGKT
jgi:hypothetical protein